MFIEHCARSFQDRKEYETILSNQKTFIEHLIGPNTVLYAKISKSGPCPRGIFTLLGAEMEIFKRMINAEIEINVGCRECSGELHLGHLRIGVCEVGSYLRKQLISCNTLLKTNVLHLHLNHNSFSGLVSFPSAKVYYSLCYLLHSFLNYYYNL